MIEGIYIRLGWPEYQEYMELEGFDNNSVYDYYNNTYFIEKEWYEKVSN